MNGTDMRNPTPPRDVRSAIQRLHDDTHEPLMSTKDIANLIASSPQTPSTPRSITQPSSSVLPLLAIAGASASAIAAAALLFVSSTNQVEVLPSSPSADIVERHSSNSSPAVVSVPSQTSASTPLPTTPSEPLLGTWSANDRALAALGVTRSASRLTYVEGNTLVSVRTSGIVSQEAKQPSNSIAPRFVSLYHGSQLAFSWFDRRKTRQKDIPQHPPTETSQQRLSNRSLMVGSVNDMICVRVDLSDQSNTFFPTATALLWYDPLPEVLEALPDSLRPTGNQTPSTNQLLVERRTTSDVVLESSVYPNPTTTLKATLALTLQQPSLATIEAFDVLGNKLATIQTDVYLDSGRHEIPIGLDPSSPSGIVILVVSFTAHEDRIIHRLLIQR